VEIVEAYGSWLAKSGALPKLFISATPGSLLVGRGREFCRSWPNQREVEVNGIHFVQEDAPADIGFAVRNFVENMRS
jgi:haloalkane dehalogenase